VTAIRNDVLRSSPFSFLSFFSFLSRFIGDGRIDAGTGESACKMPFLVAAISPFLSSVFFFLFLLFFPSPSLPSPSPPSGF